MKLLEIQRTMANALMNAQCEGWSQAIALIKPNDRLTSLQRFEIYSRSYWMRLMDSLREDFPGLQALLGVKTFDRLARLYLSDCPSRSHTLRDLGSELPQWLEGHREEAGRNPRLAFDMARLEWAHIFAVDAGSIPAVGVGQPNELKAELRLGLQPYVSLLELDYPVDVLRVLVNGGRKRILRQKPERVYVAVHRVDSVVYYKRLRAVEYRILKAVEQNCSIGQALESAFEDGAHAELVDEIEAIFASWAQMGWLTTPNRKTGVKK